ncbi:hypothetical protein BDF21DRAFT_222756 [Thamnidium elegans]|nr:hypothetical protein BDF21DRAFT_222756 [Thamnidium elegans]
MATPKDNEIHNIKLRHLPSFKLLSYADDLEVFLTSPEEWPHLQEMLQCYSLASNAKVNIHKTELVSLLGLENAVRKEIAHTSSIDYHTTASPDAVRYLGYPLYSNQQQSDSSLQTIEKKIGNHAFLLKDRHLSVRGSSLIANSLLLSRLWHILRVVPVPNKWLFSIRQVVRKFVLSFWPAPSWDQICLPKSHGGLGVVDPQVQQITLQLIYLRRLMQSKSDTDFASPLVGASLYLYTGHKSFLPWVQYPSLFLPLLKKLPTMQVLTRLIQELPPLKKSSNWSGSFLADTPLRVALITTDPNTVDSVEHLRSDRTFVPSKISINRLVSDVIAWYPHANQYHNFLQVGLPKQEQPTKAYRLLQQNDGGVSWTSQFSDSMPATSEAYSRPPENTPNPSLEHPTYPKWLPSCHWYIYTDSSHRVMVSQIRNGYFRLHVQLSRRRKKLAHKMITTSGNIYVPYSTPPNYLPPKIWKQFWALPLPHKTLTIWWRHIHDRVAYQKTLHRWRISSCTNSLCGICRSESETNEHFFVSCFHKWTLWKKAIEDMNLNDTFPSPETVWIALFTLHDKICQQIPEDILLSLGTVLEII